MALYNRINGKILKEQLKSIEEQRTTLSFYKYHPIGNPGDFRNELYRAWIDLGVLGRIYVSKEGINAQLSIPSPRLQELKDHLDSTGFLRGIRLNIAIEDNGKSFFKLKIQVRNKIVADGITDETFNPSDSGVHLNAAEYNRITSLPGTLVVDMRNHYESEVGRFQNSICPDADTFRDALPIVENKLSDKKDSPVVMYCTGGIRCEKASAWLKHRGFKNVFQLDGGIIEYARQVAEQGLENKFIGKNFVFDERLGERISGEVISVCHQCGEPGDTHTNCRNEACHLLFIQCEKCAAHYDGCCSEECQQIVALPLEEQQYLRKGKAQGRMIYRKGRSENIKFRIPASTNSPAGNLDQEISN